MLLIPITIIWGLVSVVDGVGIGNWIQMSSSSNPNIKGIDISAKNNDVYLLGNDSTIYWWNSVDWIPVSQEGGPVAAAAQIGAALDSCLWVVDKQGGLTVYNKNTSQWSSIPAAPSPLAQISGQYCDRALGVSTAATAGKILLYQNGGWSTMPGGVVNWAAIGECDERWVAGNDGDLWRWDTHALVFYRPGGMSLQVDAQNATRIALANPPNGYAYISNGATWVNTVAGTAIRASIGRTWTYYLSNTGVPYYATVTP